MGAQASKQATEQKQQEAIGSEAQKHRNASRLRRFVSVACLGFRTADQKGLHWSFRWLECALFFYPFTEDVCEFFRFFHYSMQKVLICIPLFFFFLFIIAIVYSFILFSVFIFLNFPLFLLFQNALIKEESDILYKCLFSLLRRESCTFDPGE